MSFWHRKPDSNSPAGGGNCGGYDSVMRRHLVFAAALLSAAADRADAPAAPKFAVPFIEDDYPKALSEARSKKVPIFVENWAPW